MTVCKHTGAFMKFVKSDGGRAAAGYKSNVGDCVARAICNATGLPYTVVYDRLAIGNATQRVTKNTRRHSTCGKATASHGIWIRRKWFKDYMAELGFTWHPTMEVGSGCKVHLKENELPKGKIVVVLSKHMAAVIDGVLHDNYDCSRGETRCVYGYYQLKQGV